MKIVVHIDRLILDDVGAQPGLARLQAALEQELTQALAATAHVTPGAGLTASVGADAPIDISRGPEAIGQAIARAAHARIVAARAESPQPAAATPAPRSARPGVQA